MCYFKSSASLPDILNMLPTIWMSFHDYCNLNHTFPSLCAPEHARTRKLSTSLQMFVLSFVCVCVLE